MTQTDPSRRNDIDEILARIDSLVSPVAIEVVHRLEAKRLKLFRLRFVNTLIDLDLPPTFGIEVTVDHGRITIRTKNRRAAEKLLRVLDHHADHHRWGTTTR